MLPGDRAAAYRRERAAHGVPVPDVTWAAIAKLADELMVPVAGIEPRSRG
jgi:LDH2 family malate/lactate/ureidoglycolate dehydrogenase